MSPSWLERVDIVFSSGALEFARRHRLRREPPARQRFEVAGGSAWTAALDKLTAVLASERPATARVRLSGQFCRFALAPWNAGLTADEQQALARAVFRETYGEAALGWEVRVDNLNRGAMLVICAVDAELVAGIAGAFDSAGWRLDSIEPLFAAALAGAGAGAAPAASWHALLEPAWCSAALIEGDAFLAVCGAPALESRGALVRALENENLRLSREVRALRLLPGSSAPPDGDFSGWTVAQA